MPAPIAVFGDSKMIEIDNILCTSQRSGVQIVMGAVPGLRATLLEFVLIWTKLRFRLSRTAFTLVVSSVSYRFQRVLADKQQINRLSGMLTPSLTTCFYL